MAIKTLLFLGGEGFHAYTWESGKFLEAQHFTDSTEGKEKFAAFLQSNSHPAYLLADLVEEDFRHEIVPHLHGRDRAELIQRKFEQFYRSTPFRQASLLQRQKEGRRDDEVLFSALTNPAIITTWLNIMLAHHVPLVGIYSVPNISAPLIHNKLSGHVLLLSWEKHAGLRQTYFDAGQLRFSRLTPVIAGNSFSKEVATEAVRTHQYLKSLSLIPAGKALSVCIACHENDKCELEAQLSDNPDIYYAYLDIQEIGKRNKLRVSINDSDATLLLLHLLAVKVPHGSYAAAGHTHFHQLLQLRHRLRWLNTALAGVCLLWSASNMWEGRWMNDEANSLREQAGKLSQQAQKIVQEFPNTLAASADMKAAVLLARSLEGHSPPPQQILLGLSKSMDAFPRIHLDKLSWEVGAAAEFVKKIGEPTNYFVQKIVLNGELLDFTNGNYRNALDYLRRFQQSLVQQGYEVTALSMPLDVSPEGSIASSAGESGSHPAQFSIKLIWKPGT